MKRSQGPARRLTHAEILELKRWNTPTIYNGWERITARDRTREAFNLEEVRDFMPQMGPMAGRAVTVVIEPSNRKHAADAPRRWSEYRKYLASVPAPKIAIVQDLDKPRFVGAGWGEVNGSFHRALGCAGAIVDGAVRDLDEMASVGFKAIASRLAVGHAYACPVRWNCEVEVFGAKVRPGQLVHADKHGFLVVSEEDERGLLEAARFLDSNECKTVLRAARESTGKPIEDILAAIDEAAAEYDRAAGAGFKRKGERP